MSVSGIADKARHWLQNAALPLWLDKGIDKQCGGFVERLHMNGRPDKEAVRRLRVQARQIYVFSHAAHLDLNLEAKSAALGGFDYLVTKGWKRDGNPGWIHLLTPSGEVADPKRDAYDHAFVLLACAWAYRASEDSQILSLARETLNYLDEAMGAANGGWLESYPHQGPRRQNPHMHMFESFLALHEATGDPEWLGRAHEVHKLFESRFLCCDSGRLTEYFEDDWSPAKGGAANRYEPGHHMEWVWLLSKYGNASGVKLTSQSEALFDFALTHGQDPVSGFLWDEISAHGEPLQATRRCWPQTELLKACLTRIEAHHSDKAREDAESVLDKLMASYVTPGPHGGWLDRYDAHGAPDAKYVPASTFYHLFCAITEANRVLTSEKESA